MKFLFATLLLFINTSMLVHGQVESKWAKETVTIDGKIDDWKTPFNFYDSESKLAYSVKNNDSILFLSFQTIDELTQLKVMRAGVEVDIATKGRNKRKAEVRFPVINEDERSAYMRSETDLQSIRRTFIFNHLDMVTDGFVSQNGTHKIGNNHGIRVALNWDSDDVMNYELAIPLAELCEVGCTVADLKGQIVVKVNVLGLDRPKGDTKDDRSMSGGGRMAHDDRMNPGGDPRAGNNPMGMPGQGTGMQRPMHSSSGDERYDRQILKLKIKLAGAQ